MPRARVLHREDVAAQGDARRLERVDDDAVVPEPAHDRAGGRRLAGVHAGAGDGDHGHARTVDGGGGAWIATSKPTGTNSTQVRPAVSVIGTPLASVKTVTASLVGRVHLPLTTDPFVKTHASPVPATLHGRERVLVFDQAEQTFVFEHIEHEPVPSLLRHFSAPVKVKLELRIDQ